MGAQGFSPRTRTDSDVVRSGAPAGRIAVAGVRGDVPVATEVALQPGAAKRAALNGAPLRAAEQLRSHLDVLVFTPDRLVVVKGGPAVRRAYVDRSLARLFPGRAALPAEYGAAVAQRNAALRRVSLGISSRDALAPWSDRVAALACELVQARTALVSTLGPAFRDRTGELGLPDARLAYESDPPTRSALDARLERDIERGTTGIGPHLDDVSILAESRDLRTFGSQGQQRVAVLALLLAEADLIAERRGVRPLLLLDDVLSELDATRRRVLAEQISGRGQALVTTTSPSSLPLEPAAIVEVSPGAARRAA